METAPHYVSNFSGFSKPVREIRTCSSAAELATVLEEARLQGRKVGFRAGGWSFDDQAQTSDLMLALNPPEVAEFAIADASVTSSGLLTWGQMYDACLKRGLVPGVAPTATSITIGGAFSSGCVSQCTPRIGKLSEGVERFQLLTGTGEYVSVHRPGPNTSPDNDDLFRAVAGGFGGLGCVTEITQRALHVAGEQPPMIRSDLQVVIPNGHIN